MRKGQMIFLQIIQVASKWRVATPKRLIHFLKCKVYSIQGPLDHPGRFFLLGLERQGWYVHPSWKKGWYQPSKGAKKLPIFI